jgi:hypothetical protein
VVGIAIGPAGHVWVEEQSGEANKIVEFNDAEANSQLESFPLKRGELGSGIAVDSHEDLYIFASGYGGFVERLSSTGSEPETVEASESRKAGMAVNELTNDLYIDLGQRVLERGAFGEPFEGPALEFGASGLGGNEDGGIAVNSSAQSASSGWVYVTEPAADKIDVFVPEPPGPVTVGNENASGVSVHIATLNAQVNPDGEDTSYYFQYGTVNCVTSPSACINVPAQPGTDIGSEYGPQTVSVQLEGLQAGTEYHYRVVATNASGTAFGTDSTFVTVPAGLSVLPDDRAYEMVTPVENHNAAVYVPSPGGLGLVTTALPSQAAAEGNAVAYESDPTTGGNGWTGAPFGNAHLATRSPEGGWTQETIESNSPAHTTNYLAFSSDLAEGIVSGCTNPVLASNAPLQPGGTNEHFEVGYNLLYSHSNQDNGSEGFSSLFTAKPRYRLPEESRSPSGFGTIGVGEIQGESYECPNGLVYAGASADFSHLLFEANDSLLEGEGKLETELDNDVKKEIEEEKASNNLYVSVDSRVTLVNVLPNGTPAPNATFGAQGPDFSHVISASGSRIFWTDLNTGTIYARENGTSTVPVSVGPARFWTASSDGRYVFYTEGEKLYRSDMEGETREQLAGAGADVKGVIGASENGESLYFVADGALAGAALAGQPNLYRWHAGVTSFVATLTEGDAADWSGVMGLRTAEVSANGGSVVFMSEQSLTGYANEGNREVYLYDAEPAGLYCASCKQTGEPGSSGFLQLTLSDTYTARSLSADNGRVFFDSEAGLVPQDTDGTADVYEWERDGIGSCEREMGCVYLLSGGSGTSYLLDASSTGNDVFFVTLSSLVPQDGNEVPDVYDARVGGQAVVASQCSGTGCQGPPTAPPPFATPASVTFEGVGNFPSPTGLPAATGQTTPKLLTRAEKLARALKACAVKRRRSVRATCVAKARKRYGAKVRTKTSTTKRGR